MVFNPQSSVRCSSCGTARPTEAASAAAGLPSGGRILSGSSGRSVGGLTFRWAPDRRTAAAAGVASPESPSAETSSLSGEGILGRANGEWTRGVRLGSPAGSDTLRAPDQPAVAAVAALAESSTAEIVNPGEHEGVEAASSLIGGILGGSSGGSSGGFNLGNRASNDTLRAPDNRCASAIAFPAVCPNCWNNELIIRRLRVQRGSQDSAEKNRRYCCSGRSGSSGVSDCRNNELIRSALFESV